MLFDMPPSPTVCLSCRLRLLARLFPHPRSPGYGALPSIRRQQQWRTLRSFVSHRNKNLDYESRQETTVQSTVSFQTRWTPHSLQFLEDTEVEETQELSDEVREQDDALSPGEYLHAAKQSGGSSEEPPSPEYIAKAARQAFGDRLPNDALNDEQYAVYTRLYGTPLADNETSDQELEDEDTRDVLYKEGTDGTLEELGALEPDLMPLGDEPSSTKFDKSNEGGGFEDPGRLSDADVQLQRDILKAIEEHDKTDTSLTIKSPGELQAVDDKKAYEDEADDLFTGTGQDSRAHPFTVASRFGTTPSAVPLPRASFVNPISHLLSNISNKHLDESAQRIFEGLNIPYSPSTPSSSRTKPQKPIPLHPSQGKMTDIEADVYMAAVMPQTYASVISVMVETRKRLGASWLENLLRREGGPRILDAGAGGAGVIAWRELLKAEWRRMHDMEGADPSDSTSTSDQKPQQSIPPTPVGKATVLTGSNALRLRASALLENTTFLPRLPDYVHAQFRPEDAQRKQYDIIVAPHSLWPLLENYERRQKVLNLWNLLDPNGGILVLLEKGVPRGFEVIADARAYIISQLFERKEGAAEDLDGPPSEVPPTEGPHTEDTATEDRVHKRLARRSPAHIVAPCPHSQKCPLYLIPGASQQRKDWCHFRQRYVRPPYLQRLIGAKDRNFEDVEFSYVAVQKGVKNEARLLGVQANERAFEGYDVEDQDVIQPPKEIPHQFGIQQIPQSPGTSNPLPRLLLPPLKREGHIHLDLCTPAGTFSRWTVPRSYGKQAYRDARKASWGDLWALGAKQREDRRVRLGLKGMEAGLGTGKGMENRAKAKRKAAGPIKDVYGIDTWTGQAMEADGGEVNSRDERIRKRREAKNHGREKARRRRREETKTLYNGVSA